MSYNTLLNMNDREWSALQRATAALRAKQPVKITSGIPGIYYDKRSQTFTAYIRENGLRLYVGRSRNLEVAKRMQREKRKELKQQNNKKNVTTKCQKI